MYLLIVNKYSFNFTIIFIFSFISSSSISFQILKVFSYKKVFLDIFKGDEFRDNGLNLGISSKDIPKDKLSSFLFIDLEDVY